MLIHYLKIAFRNMWKYRTQSLIGIFGLAFGLACFVPALYWLRYETTYDSFYPDAAHIYRIYAVEKQSGKTNPLVPIILGEKMSEQLPAIEASTVFFIETNNYGTERMPHIRLRTLNTCNSFFEVFPQEFVSGDARQALQIRNNMVLTETVAVRLFGDAEKAIGQQIQSTFYSSDPPYTVTAVVKDPPPNTNLSFDALLYSGMLDGIAGDPEETQWVQFLTQTYVKLHPLTDVNELAEQLRDFPSQSHANANFEARMLPVSDVRHQLNAGTPFTLNFIRLFIAAGVLLLFSALFNFINLYIDLFNQRISELRQRAVHGAKSRQIIGQMMFELTCAILPALALACFLVILTRPVFYKLLGIELSMMQLIQLFVVCGIGAMALMLLVGSILFHRLSRLAIRYLSKRKITGGQPMFRRMAVTLQLAVSVVLIVASLVVMMQLRFVSRKDLGFDHSGIIQLYGLPSFMRISLRTALINELKAIPQIENITTSNFEPQLNTNTSEPQLNANNVNMTTVVEWPGKSSNEKPAFHIIPADSRFAETLELNILMGEWYNESGIQKIVLNEEAVRVMGLKEPVGTIIRISIYNIEHEGFMGEYEVAGVVNDFHTLSLRSRIHPTIFRHSFFSERMSADNILYIRVASGQEQEAIRRINAILPTIDPSFANLRLMTLGDLYDGFNRSEQAGLKLFSVLATVCLLISLFGIYAVATAATQRRRKEIAIRKVFGAKVEDIIRLFFREHTRQVIIASVVALPLAYYAMHQWLQGYAYRTNIPWWLLMGVIMIIVVVVLLTVLGQVLKAANSNPAEVVKAE